MHCWISYRRANPAVVRFEPRWEHPCYCRLGSTSEYQASGKANGGTRIHRADESTKKKFDEGKYKSREIYGSPTDPTPLQGYQEYLKRRLEELRKKRNLGNPK